MFCALLTSRYQVSVYRTNGPLVVSYFFISFIILFEFIYLNMVPYLFMHYIFPPFFILFFYCSNSITM